MGAEIDQADAGKHPDERCEDQGQHQRPEMTHWLSLLPDVVPCAPYPGDQVLTVG